MIRDILLQLSTYPARTPDRVFAAVAPLAKRLDARVSAALCQVHIPRVSNYLADKLVGANQAIAQQNALSRDHARQLAEAFVAQLPEDHRGEQFLIDCTSFLSGDRVAEQARIFDLTIVPVFGGEPQHVLLAEALVFGSGRPVLLLPDGAAVQRGNRLVIGWDGGRAAARALADALPFCRETAEVQIVAVTGEKPLGLGPGLEAVRAHLQRHGIVAEPVEIAADGEDAGVALLRHAERVEADLVVAGAFGHSRAREFILGGATRSMMAAPKVPVLMSH